jgi:hypothetical protein
LTSAASQPVCLDDLSLVVLPDLRRRLRHTARVRSIAQTGDRFGPLPVLPFASALDD